MLRNLFHDLRDLELACKEFFLNSDADLTIVAIVATICLIPPRNYLDYHYYGFRADYFATCILEALMALISIVTVLFIRRNNQVINFERWVFAWSVLTAAAASYSVFDETSRIIENVLFSELFLAAIFAVMTNRLSFRLIPAFLVNVACLAALLTTKAASFENRYMLSWTLLLVNLAGIVVVARNNRYKRLAYEAQTSEREARRLFEALAITDPLTGILNRRSFFDQVRQELSRFQRFHSTFCLVMIDLDLFEKVNDNYGRLAGDAALKQFASTAVLNKRAYDVFGRIGGKEFGLLLPYTDEAEAVQVVARIQDKVHTLAIVSPKGDFRITFSAGVTGAQDNDKSLDDLIHRADEALYRSKEEGRDRIRVAG